MIGVQGMAWNFGRFLATALVVGWPSAQEDHGLAQERLVAAPGLSA